MLDTTGDPARTAVPAVPAGTDPDAPRGLRLGRRLSWFFVAFGAWSWIVWTTFVKNLVKDASGLAFDHGSPTAYFFIHLLLAIVSFLLGTAIGVVGIRGLRALRRPAA